MFNLWRIVCIFNSYGTFDFLPIKIQLYTALIGFVLIRLIQEEINNKYSILKITRIIRIYITKRISLLSVFLS